MPKLMQACAPWLSWKVGAVFVAVVLVVGSTFGANAGLFAFLGATPILAIAACMVPCLIPLAFLRGTKNIQSNPTQNGTGCSCGSDACTIGAGADSCQTKAIAVVKE